MCASAQACSTAKAKHRCCLTCTHTAASVKSTPKHFCCLAAFHRFWPPGGDYNNSTPNELCNFLRRRVCTLNFVDPTKWAAEFNEHCKLTDKKWAANSNWEWKKYFLQKIRNGTAFVQQNIRRNNETKSCLSSRRNKRLRCWLEWRIATSRPAPSRPTSSVHPSAVF